MSKVWKWLGLAGVFGAAATGAAAVVVRQDRVRRAYTPDQIRERLHQRLEEAEAEESPQPGD